MGRVRAGWILAGLALVLAAVLRVLMIEGRTAAYVAGAAFGAVVGSVLLALLARFAYVRLVRRGRPLWSPWVLAIAAVVSLIVAASRAGSAAQERAAAQRGGAGGARIAAQLVERHPGGWRSVPAARELIDQLSTNLPRHEARRFTARSIQRGAEPVGAVVVIELGAPGSETELFAGFEDGAREQAAEVEDAPLGTARGKLFRAPDGGATLVGLSDRCAAALVFGVSPRITLRIAAGLPVRPA
jgi:hypothetical protein